VGQRFTIRKEHEPIADRSDLQVLDARPQELIDKLRWELEPGDVNPEGFQQGRRDTQDAGIAFCIDVDHEARQGDLE
jgi:hypothetical protein